MGLERGDKVAFLMDNGLVTAQLFLGTMYGGFVAVPLNVRAGVTQLSYMLDHCDAKVVFVEEQYTAFLAKLWRASAGTCASSPWTSTVPCQLLKAGDGRRATDFLRPADDVALLMYSSGSTGKPKGAIHTHSSVLAHGRNSIEAHQLSPNGSVTSCPPALSHQRGVRHADSYAVERRFGGCCSSLCGQQVLGLDG